MKENIIYLNNGATTWPKPPEVMEAVQESLRLPYYEEGRSTIKGQTDYVTETRKALAEFFNAEIPENFSFTQNATDSLNILIHGFVKEEGAPFHVITTELEHNSVLRPLTTLENEGKITLTIVPFGPDGHIDPEEIRKAIREDTCLAVISHGSNVLGSVQDIEAIGKILHSEEIFFIVDGAQTAGYVDIDLSALPVDAFAFTGHKGLLGLPGIGGFYIKDPASVAPLKQGGTGIDSESRCQNEEMPYRFEPGTHNYPGVVSLGAGIRYLKHRGQDAVRHVDEMTEYLLSELEKEEKIIIYNRHPDLGVIAFNIEGIDNEEVGYILSRAYGIITRSGLHCAPLVHKKIDRGMGCVRISLSCMNTMEECEVAAAAIREVARSEDC